MRRTLVFLLTLFSATVSLAATVTAVHEQRFRLMVANDLDKLAPMLADDLVYIHSDAKVESKKEFLDRLRSGDIRYRQIDPSEPVVRDIGRDAAIVTGRAKMIVMLAGTDRQLDMRYTAVYRSTRGKWQLVSWQSTRVP